MQGLWTTIHEHIARCQEAFPIPESKMAQRIRNKQILLLINRSPYWQKPTNPAWEKIKIKSIVNYHNGTHILRFKAIEQKLNVVSKHFVHPLSNQTPQVDGPSQKLCIRRKSCWLSKHTTNVEKEGEVETIFYYSMRKQGIVSPSLSLSIHTQLHTHTEET